MTKSLFALSLIFFSALTPLSSQTLPAAKADTIKEQNLILDLGASPLTHRIMEKLKELFHIESLVEIGPKHRDIAANGLQFFNEVFTIETDHSNFLKTQRRFKTAKNIHCHEGKTEEILEKILPVAKGRLLFWVDGRDVENSYQIEEELKAIFNSKQQEGIILISDVHSFTNSESKSLLGLQKTINKLNPNYAFWISGEYAIAYPKSDPVVPSPLVEAYTESSLFEKTSSAQKVLEAEKLIMHAYKSERSGQDPSKKEIHFFQSSIPPLWEGLAHLESKNYKEAVNSFHTALSLGEDHFRLYWYLALAETERRNYDGAKDALKHVLRAAPDFEEAKKLAEKIDLEGPHHPLLISHPSREK